MKTSDALDPLPDFTAEPNELPQLRNWIESYGNALTGRLAVTERRDFSVHPPSLYLDTSVVSYLTAWLSRDTLKAKRQLQTRRWWNERRHGHLLYVSDLVIEEASDGDSTAARSRLDVIETLTCVHSNEQSHEIARHVLSSSGLPEGSYDDAHHVALCAIHGIEVLLTWNCTHLANENIIPRIGRACEEHGYAAPEILTPEQLTGACAYGLSAG